MTKKELRHTYRQKRQQLSPTQIRRLDDLMLIQFQRLSFAEDVQVLLSYMPIPHNAETDTHLFERYMQHSIPGLQLAYPLIDFEQRLMQPVLVNPETDFETNQYNIDEPVDGEPINPQIIDVVFVPLLAFDELGFRVGYGKGFYDRFLQQCRPDVVAIGFSYFEAVGKIEDTHQYDIPLNYCITPHQLYEF